MPDPVEQLFGDAPEIGRTDALLVVQGGNVVVERCGPGIESTTTGERT